MREIVTRLSPQQDRVMRLAARGATNAEIGFALGISEQTVKNHIRIVCAKVDATNRIEAALRTGHLRLPEGE